MSETTLPDLQAELLARAKADEYLGAVCIVDERVGDITKSINEALGLVTAVSGKLGACIILQQPIASNAYNEIPGGLLQLDINFLVLEDVTLNSDATAGTLKTALALARRLVRVFQHFSPVGVGQPLVTKTPCITPTEPPQGDLAYNVGFTTIEADSDAFLKVAPPVISPNTGAAPQTVTITCATSGAAIWYTLDGSAPWSGNPTALLYTAPVNVLAAGKLRAAAFKNGSIGSDIPRGIYT